MVTASIGIRELQQNASKYVREVEEGRAVYRVTVQGRDTGVSLAKDTSGSESRGIRASDLAQSVWWRRQIPEDVKQKMLAFVEEGRDASGYVGDGHAWRNEAQ